MNEETAFLRAIQERPDDDTTRLVYADWLEEQGGEAGLAKAKFIRTDCELAGLPDQDERREGLQARQRQLAGGLDVAWRAAVSKARIEKCWPLRFAFQCPMQWDKLAPTEARSERFCNSCQQTVYYCATQEEAIGHANVGHCVAVDARVVLGAHDLEGMVAGMLFAPDRPAWDNPAPAESDEAPPRRRKRR
jgi:uncharacterized protein (TIGR02996 family)